MSRESRSLSWDIVAGILLMSLVFIRVTWSIISWVEKTELNFGIFHQSHRNDWLHSSIWVLTYLAGRVLRQEILAWDSKHDNSSIYRSIYWVLSWEQIGLGGLGVDLLDYHCSSKRLSRQATISNFEDFYHYLSALQIISTFLGSRMRIGYLNLACDFRLTRLIISNA